MRVRTGKDWKHAGKAPDTATREILLDTASNLMIDRGSTEITLSDIAEKSGLNSALVRYYFGNKSGLLMALLRKTLAPSMQQIEHLSVMSISPQNKLRIHISGMMTTYFRYPYVNRLMHQVLSDDPAVFGPMIAEEFSKPVAKIQKEILDEGFKLGLFGAVDPLLFYFHVVGACDQFFFGRYQLEHVFGVGDLNETLKRQYAEHLSEILLNGILAKPSVYHQVDASQPKVRLDVIDFPR